MLSDYPGTKYTGLDECSEQDILFQPSKLREYDLEELAISNPCDLTCRFLRWKDLTARKRSIDLASFESYFKLFLDVDVYQLIVLDETLTAEYDFIIASNIIHLIENVNHRVRVIEAIERRRSKHSSVLFRAFTEPNRFGFVSASELETYDSILGHSVVISGQSSPTMSTVRLYYR